MAVSKIGRILLLVPSLIRSPKLLIPFSLSSFQALISTKPLSTEMPKRTIKPMPAEILKGMSLIQSENTPPMAERGIATYIIVVCLKDPKAK